MSDLINHWIVHTNEVPEDLAALCKRASDRQRAAERCEREYRQFLQEVGLDPHAVNNRGLVVVEDEEAESSEEEGATVGEAAGESVEAEPED